ncbi:hypothetical protein CSPX01_11033, partial [Colletotrichum filicis]
LKAGRGRAAHRDEPHIILPKLISTHLPLSLTEYADLLHQYHHTSSSDSLCDTQHLPLQANGHFSSQMPGTASSASHETLPRSGLQLLQDDQRGLSCGRQTNNKIQILSPFPHLKSHLKPQQVSWKREIPNSLTPSLGRCPRRPRLVDIPHFHHVGSFMSQ